jgi:tetratricopeptide (TPR) repeat protein
MLSDERINLEVANATAYEDLVAAIEGSDGVLSLLLAVCDDPQMREATIRRYEVELQPKILPYRIEMPRTDPSLRRVIAEKIAQEPYLQEGGRAVLTVLGAEGLSFLTLGDEKSEQDTFLGYLQWTREALRAFQYPIVLWVTSQLLVKLSRKAPDFWSWRKDVFRFVSKKTVTVSSQAMEPLRLVFESLGLQSVTEDDSIPLEDLRQLIAKTESRLGHDRNDKLLATLYSHMGRICASRIEQGESIRYVAELQEALDYFRKAAEIETALGLEAELATSLGWQGHLYQSQGCYADAELLYRQSLEIREHLLRSDHPDIAQSLNNLATLYISQGRYVDAEPLFIRSISICEQSLGLEHLNVSTSLNNLAELYRNQGRDVEAEPLFIRALSISEKHLGADHLDVAINLNNIALLFISQRRYAEAEQLLIRSLAIREQQLGTDHPAVAVCLHSLAELYHNQKRDVEAEQLLIRSLSISEKHLGADHPEVAACLNSLATLYYSQKRFPEAESLFSRSLSIWEKQLGADHPDVAVSLNNLAVFYSAQSRYAEAEPFYVRALSIRENRLGANHPYVAQSLNNLAEFYRTQGRYSDAEPLYVRSLEIAEGTVGQQQHNTVMLRGNLLACYEQMSNQFKLLGHDDKIIELLEKMIVLRSTILQKTDRAKLPRELSNEKLSWDDTYRAIAAEDENWTDFDVVLLDGLEDDAFDTETL